MKAARIDKHRSKLLISSSKPRKNQKKKGEADSEKRGGGLRPQLIPQKVNQGDLRNYSTGK